MARSVIWLGVFAGSLCMMTSAGAQQQNGGYIAVSKMQIDPRMGVLNDGPDPQATRVPLAHGGVDAGGVPLDQMGDQNADADPDAPLGDDPYADNAVETDTVYSI